MRAAALAAGAVAALTACGHRKASWEYAVPPGEYDVAAPLCESTGAPPAYPDAAHKAALFDFDLLTQHTLTLQGTTSAETFADDDCALTLQRTIYDNEGATFSLRRDRKFTFTPDGCTLTLTAAGRTQQVGKAFSELFTDSDDTREELPFATTRGDDGASRFLVTAAFPELGELWTAFGCPSADRLLIRLTPRPKS